MTSTDRSHRFGGISRLLGQKALSNLEHTHITVIGIGGVGSWAAEALARTGVGHISLIDADEICVTNINRQIHALQPTIGQSKIAIMKARLQEINPALRIHTIEDFIDNDNLQTYITHNQHAVIDAIDNAKMKAALITHCRRLKIPIVTCGSAGGKTDPSQLSHSDLTKTHNDPLLAKTRRILRQDYHFSRNPKRSFGVRAVFSAEQMVYPDASGGVCARPASDLPNEGLDCGGGFGSSMMMTASMGLLAAHLAINQVLSRMNTP